MNQIRETLCLENRYAQVVLLAPAAAILAGITVVPIIYALGVSFTEYQLDSTIREFAGLRHYARALGDSRFWNGLGSTVKFAIGALLFEIVLGMVIALGMNRIRWGSGLMRSLIIIPMLSTPVVVALLWILMLNPQYGLINYLFGVIGLPPQTWLSEPKYALWALVLVDIWEWTPFAVLILFAGLQSIPPEIYEAAEIDGAGAFQIFLRVTFPSLQSFILVVTVFRFMDAFRWFDTIAVITKGGPGSSTETWSLYGYFTAFEFLDMGYSAALGVLMLLVVIFTCQFIIKRVLTGETRME